MQFPLWIATVLFFDILESFLPTNPEALFIIGLIDERIKHFSVRSAILSSVVTRKKSRTGIWRSELVLNSSLYPFVVIDTSTDANTETDTTSSCLSLDGIISKSSVVAPGGFLLILLDEARCNLSLVHTLQSDFHSSFSDTAFVLAKAIRLDTEEFTLREQSVASGEFPMSFVVLKKRDISNSNDMRDDEQLLHNMFSGFEDSLSYRLHVAKPFLQTLNQVASIMSLSIINSKLHDRPTVGAINILPWCSRFCNDAGDCWELFQRTGTSDLKKNLKQSGYNQADCFLKESWYKKERKERALLRIHEEKSDVSSLSMQDAFTKQYIDCPILSQSKEACASPVRWRLWGEDDDAHGMGSGPGASVEGSTAIREYLPSIVARFNISSILDAAFGSFHWMPLILKQLEASNPSLVYHGVDIVPNVVSNARKNYFHKNWNFCVGDISTPNFTFFPNDFNSDPNLYCKGIVDVDLIIARDVFFHLSYSKIKCAINNFIRSRSKYLLATIDPTASWAVEPVTGILNQGGHRKVNLFDPPLHFTSSLLSFVEHNHLHEYSSIDGRLLRQREMHLWELHSLHIYEDVKCG